MILGRVHLRFFHLLGLLEGAHHRRHPIIHRRQGQARLLAKEFWEEVLAEGEAEDLSDPKSNDARSVRLVGPVASSRV